MTIKTKKQIDADRDARRLVEDKAFILDAALRVAISPHSRLIFDGQSPVEIAALILQDYHDLVAATFAGHGLNGDVGGSDSGDPA